MPAVSNEIWEKPEIFPHDNESSTVVIDFVELAIEEVRRACMGCFVVAGGRTVD
jgi:hypothetical protein